MTQEESQRPQRSCSSEDQASLGYGEA